MNKIYTKSFRNAIGIGASAFRSDYEGGAILLGGGKGWGTQPTITPLIRNPPNEVKLYGGDFLLGGEIILYYVICGRAAGWPLASWCLGQEFSLRRQSGAPALSNNDTNDNNDDNDNNKGNTVIL